MNVISSVGHSDSEILSNILRLHIGKETFDLDPCFSKGNFYIQIPAPNLRFDIHPLDTDVQKGDCRSLPLGSGRLDSIVFDPPFMFGTHGQTKNNKMNKRFTMFDTWDELVEMYQASLREFHRLLKSGGVLVFKCQDYTDAKSTMTHCFVWQWAIDVGFYPRDLFILHWKGGRIYNPNLVQRHARKFHSYYWVFKK